MRQKVLQSLSYYDIIIVQKEIKKRKARTWKRN